MHKNNKHQYSRYRTLNKCFRNCYKKYYIEDLIEACEDALEREFDKHIDVSRETIFADIRYMETGYGADIVRIQDGKRKYYRYADTNFSIERTPLTDDESQKLQEMISMLSRFRAQFPWMEKLLTKLQAKFHLDGHSESIIGFDSNVDIQGIEYLEKLFQYIINQQTIAVTYQPFDKPEQHWTLHPYYIKQHNNRWFLFARNNDDGMILNVALDRIVSVVASKERYIPNTDIDFNNDYFFDVIGVTIPESSSVETVRLRFAPKRLPYVISKPIHNTQKIKDSDNGIVEIKVIPNKELEALILWFGDDVEVLEPAMLREQIRDKIAKMHNLYLQCI